MILFFNVFITPKGLKHSYNRNGLKSFDNFDIFYYCLSTIAPIYKWSKIILQIKLDEAYKHREEELKFHIANIFNPPYTLRIGFRNERQKDWIKTIEELDDELIFYSCNHDHIFIDNNYEYFRGCVDVFKKYQNEVGMFALSHYPDYIPLIKTKPYKIDGPVFITDTPESASFTIITKSLWKKWWTEVDFGDAYLPRSDWGAQLVGHNVHHSNFLVPSREIFRHFDGYHNIVNPTSYHMEHFPPLEIPHNYTPNLDKIEKALNFYIGKGPEYDYLYGQNKDFLEHLQREYSNIGKRDPIFRELRD